MELVFVETNSLLLKIMKRVSVDKNRVQRGFSTASTPASAAAVRGAYFAALLQNS